MRVLVESPNCNALAGSNGAVGYGWVARLARAHEVHVVVSATTYDRGHAGGRAPDLAGVHPIRVAPSRARRAGTLAGFVFEVRRMRDRLIDEVRPDVVHSLEPSGWPGVRALATERVPYVLGPLTGGASLPPRAFAEAVLEALPVSPARALVHGGPRALAVTLLNEALFGGTPTARAAARRAMAKARRIVLGTELSPGAVPAGLDPRVERIPLLGVDLDAFAPVRRRGAKRQRVVLYAGRIVAIKGLHLVVEAVARTGWHLRVAGSSPPEEAWYERHCRALCDALGIADRVTWLGTLGRETLAAEYARADLYAMCSLWDTFGITYVEAMASGTPVVALATGGAPEVVRPGAGWLLRPTSPADVVERLTDLLDGLDRDRLAAAGDRARAVAERTYAWERLIERMDETYRAAAGR